MARTAKTKTHNIYLLNKEKVIEKFLNKKDNEIIDDDMIISCVMNASPNKYTTQTLKDGINTGVFSVKLFYRQEPPLNTRLSLFCSTFVQDNQDVVFDTTKSSSSIMFVYSAKHIFVITTGQGFRVVENFCIPKFGMIVVSTFQKLFKITALDSNGMSSIVHSNKTIYTNEIDFVDVNSLDTIFKEVTGRLNDKHKVHSLLNLESSSKKNSVKVTAKNYIQFSSALSFDSLIHLLEQINVFDFSTLQDTFNLIMPISPKQSPSIVESNNQEIIKKLFNAISANKSIGMDLFHRNTNDFISADLYRIECDSKELATTDDIEPAEFIAEAFATFLGTRPSSLALFSDFIIGAKIIAQKGDIDITEGSILSHISGEIEVGNKNYYVFYGEYYFLSDSYSDRLNRSLKGKLQDGRFVKYLKTKWKDGDKEDDFNENASIDEKYVHLHKIKPEYIEFADLLKIEGDKMLIVHVKDGFDDDMRALDRQVELSASRVLDLKNNNNDTFMRKLYQNAKGSTKGRNIVDDFPTEDDFIKSVKEKEIQYIIAIRPPKKDLLMNRSNIAKHCLNALILRCFNQGIDLKINIL